MKQIITIFILTNSILTAYCQDFKDIKPQLTDSTKIVKIDIDIKNEFERIYYIDYAANSQAKTDLTNFEPFNLDPSEELGMTYLRVMNNLKNKPPKISSNLPEKWVKVFKYKGDWVLFNDIPKRLLTDTYLITFFMDGPFISVIIDYKQDKNKYEYSLMSYNWDNPTTNLKSGLQIKIIDPKSLIALWRYEFQGQVTYDLMIPINQISHFPAMVLLENSLMDDEYDIFDEINYEELWNK